MLSLFKNAREPMSSYTHFLGAIFYVLAGVLLLIKSFGDNRPTAVILAITVFVISLAVLYNASWIYHYIITTPGKTIHWRKLDHSMIYVLIAGTYTPICIYYYPGRGGIIFALVMWTLALIGITIKLCWFQAPRWLSTAMYLAMGWAAIFNFKPIVLQDPGALVFLLLGGGAYSIGAVIYALKKPDISAIIGFHEFFHLFVLLGTFCHFLLMWLYIA